LKLCQNILLRFLVALVIISSLVVHPAYSQETEDSQVFISGFNAYQQKDYVSSIEMMNEVLQKYPDSPLRDMALFWLSRSYYKSGNLQEAARNLSLFSKEYPDNPLKSTVEDDLLGLVARYEKGEKLPSGSPLPKQSERLAAQKAKAEKERIASAKAAEAKKAAEAAEAARAAAAKAEQEQIALAKAEEAKRVATAEAARVAALKVAEEKAAAEKQELERLASVKAEQERIASEEATRRKAEQERLAVAKVDETRKAAELAEQERITATKAAEAKRVADEAEAARVAAVKAEQERITATAAAEAQRVAAAEAARLNASKQAEEQAAAEKKEQERIASAKTDQERVAREMAVREKAEQERIAAIQAEDAREEAAKAEQERAAVARTEEAKRVAEAEIAHAAALKKEQEEKREQDRIASIKAEQERIALETAAREKEEQQRIAVAKAEEARKTAEKAEQERLASAKAEEDRRNAAKAEQERMAVLKAEEALRVEAAAEAARIAARKAEEERLAKVQAEQERVAQAQAELARMTAIKAEEERIAATEKAERDRVAQAKAEEAKRAAAEAEVARLASLKAEEERMAAERKAKEEEHRRLIAQKTEEERLAVQKLADEKAVAAKLAYREKAIAQYKTIIDKYPTTTAAVSAAAKLRELGIAVALPPVEAPLPENAQVLRLVVAQFAGFEFNLLSRPDAFTVGKSVTVPFEIINRGNGKDSFQLESAFPAEFKARFASAADPSVAISQTPELGSGDVFRGVISLVIPPASIDGLRIIHPVKVASRLMAEASQSREVKLVASAPLLRAVMRTENTKPLPGDKVVYRIAVLNVGSTAAQDVTFRLNYPPQLEPLDHAAAGFKQEQKSALVFDGLQVNSGESREFSVTFQLKDDSLAGQELSTRADLINNPLKTSGTFVSNVTYVEAQRSILVRSGAERQVAIPGQTITVPFIVTNTGNIREKFKIVSNVTGAQDAVIFNDINRDGIRQASEPVISEIGPLAPREEASVVVEIKTPKNATDNSQGSVQVTFVSEGDVNRSASGSTQLAYSRPVLKMLMAARDGQLKPGDIASFDLNITNHGSNLARVVELQSAWPEQLELIASEPGTSEAANGTIIWRFKELGAGEKRTIKVSFRVKPGTGVGTAIQVRNILTYEDQLGNRY
jgi:hypothetical protein